MYNPYSLLQYVNDFKLSSCQTGLRSERHVELFFRWIKQHLRVKAFLGTSENAVKAQLWIAMSVYVLVAIIRKRLNLSRSLYEILQILSVNQFENPPLDMLLARFQSFPNTMKSDNQLILFD